MQRNVKLPVFFALFFLLRYFSEMTEQLSLLWMQDFTGFWIFLVFWVYRKKKKKKAELKLRKKIGKMVREEEIWYWDVNHTNHWNCRLKTKKSQRKSKRKNYIGFRSSWRQKKMKQKASQNILSIISKSRSDKQQYREKGNVTCGERCPGWKSKC